MDLLYLILVFVVVGVVLWLINTYIPMQPQVKSIMNVLVIIGLVVFFIYFLFGLAGGGPSGAHRL
jgi:hypothetical protein